MEDTEKEILRLINETTEKQDKAFLLILYKMFQGLKHNTESILRVETDINKTMKVLDKHIIDKEVAFGAIRGGWRVTLIAMSVVSLLIGTIQFLGWNVIDNHIKQNMQDSNQIDINSKRLYDLEKWRYLDEQQIRDLNRAIEDLREQRLHPSLIPYKYQQKPKTE